MNDIDFHPVVQASADVVSAALEVATAHSVLSTYKIHNGSFEVDPDSGKELTEQEKAILDKFQEDMRNQVEAVILEKPATEAFLDVLGEFSTRDTAVVASNTAKRIANAVNVYGKSIDKMLSTLQACAKRLDALPAKTPIAVAFEFGAYSRFFHIAGEACVSPNDFISGIYIHRTTSEWAMRAGTECMRTVYDYAKGAFTSMHRTLPELSKAIADTSYDRALELVYGAYAEPVRQGMALRSMSAQRLSLPRKAAMDKAFTYTPKGYLFDASVLCTVRAKREGQDYANGAIVLQDEGITRTKVTGWDIADLRTLRSIVQHGIEIASNVKTNLDTMSDLSDDFLKPIADALQALTRRMRFREEQERQLLLSQVKIAQMLCNTAVHPLLMVLWLDIRLVRTIAGVAEAYFVGDPKKRIVLKSEISKL